MPLVLCQSRLSFCPKPSSFPTCHCSMLLYIATLIACHVIMDPLHHAPSGPAWGTYLHAPFAPHMQQCRVLVRAAAFMGYAHPSFRFASIGCHSRSALHPTPSLPHTLMPCWYALWNCIRQCGHLGEPLNLETRNTPTPEMAIAIS